MIILQDVEIGDNNGGTDIVVTTNDYFPETVIDSSGNVDISFNYWEEGKQLFYPHKEADISTLMKVTIGLITRLNLKLILVEQHLPLHQAVMVIIEHLI